MASQNLVYEPTTFERYPSATGAAPSNNPSDTTVADNLYTSYGEPILDALGNMSIPRSQSLGLYFGRHSVVNYPCLPHNITSLYERQKSSPEESNIKDLLQAVDKLKAVLGLIASGTLIRSIPPEHVSTYGSMFDDTFNVLVRGVADITTKTCDIKQMLEGELTYLPKGVCLTAVNRSEYPLITVDFLGVRNARYILCNNPTPPSPKPDESPPLDFDGLAALFK